MADSADRKYSIWTIPKESWRQRADLDSAQVTPESIEAFKNRKSEPSDDRIKQFETRTPGETFSKTVN